MKIICAGLSKTGTSSLAAALKILGYDVFHFAEHIIHHQKEWLEIYQGSCKPDFKLMYDREGSRPDAVADIPPAYFFDELIDAFPDAKVILTTREEGAWFESFLRHASLHQEMLDMVRTARGDEAAAVMEEFVRLHHRVIYGSEVPNEFIYKKKFRQHNERVVAKVKADNLLVMPVEEASWEAVCGFLGLPAPGTPYPKENQQGELRILVEKFLQSSSPSG